MKFSGKVEHWPVKKWFNFGGDSHHDVDTWTVFRIRHYWEMRKVVINGHKSAVHTDLPDGCTSRTCLGGGMHCPSASSSSCVCDREPIRQ